MCCNRPVAYLPLLIIFITLIANIGVAYKNGQIDHPFQAMSYAASFYPSRQIFLTGLVLTALSLQLIQFHHTSPVKVWNSLSRMMRHSHIMTLYNFVEEIHLFWLPYGFMIGMIGLGYWNNMNIPLDRRLHNIFTNLTFMSIFLWFLTNQKTRNSGLVVQFIVYLTHSIYKTIRVYIFNMITTPSDTDVLVQWSCLFIMMISFLRHIQYDASQYCDYYKRIPVVYAPTRPLTRTTSEPNKITSEPIKHD